MKLSCCVDYKNYERLKALKDMGFDCIETSLWGLAGETEENIAELYEYTNKIDLPFVSYNGMFPSDIRLTGENTEFERAQEYLVNTMEKLKALRVPNVIFGSGAARNVPEGFSKEKATYQLIEFLSDYVAPVAKKYHFVCGIEELRSAECNIINSCGEAFQIIKQINKPEIQLLVDYFHMSIENETPEDLYAFRHHISHIHIASPTNDRKFPNKNDGDDYKRFFAVIKDICPKDIGVSIEGRASGDFEMCAKESLNYLKSFR